jgi:hypothetical protein
VADLRCEPVSAVVVGAKEYCAQTIKSSRRSARHCRSEGQPFRRLRLQESRVGSPVAQRLANGIETPGGKVNEHIYWTHASVAIEPRHCFIEITQRQLHLFSRGVVRRN